MPQCKVCSSCFPSRIKIGDKIHVLKSRKLCLECSPFNDSREITHLDKKELICEDCGRSWFYVKGSGGTIKRCNSCVTRKRRADGRLRAYAYKGDECLMCGYNRCKDALCFHHVDSDNKRFQIGDNVNRAWESLKLELDKCVLLCSVCHIEHHAGLIQDEAIIEKEKHRLNQMGEK